MNDIYKGENGALAIAVTAVFAMLLCHELSKVMNNGIAHGYNMGLDAGSYGTVRFNAGDVPPQFTSQPLYAYNKVW